jgi:HEAT repeat protein
MAHGKPAAYWIQALSSNDTRLRRKAVQVLGNVGASDSMAVPALTRALKDKDVEVRRGAVLALLQIGPAAQAALPALRELQDDEDAQVRSFASKAVERMPQKH